MKPATDRARCSQCGDMPKPYRDSIRKLRSGPNIGRRARVREYFCRCGRTWADVRPVEAGEG